MIKADKNSFAGVICALIAVAVFAGTGILGSVFANGLGNAPRELRLGAEIGLIQPKDCNSNYLKANVSRRLFSQKIAQILDLVGIPNCDEKFMLSSGLLLSDGHNKLITRKEAVEMMARATLLLKNTGIINIDSVEAKNFSDYKIPEKYALPIGYMQSKFVVRGMSNNKLAANKKLTKREAVYFLYRLYEAVSSDMMTKKQNEGLCFIDISWDHPIMETINDLTAAGAFDRAILRPSFDGDSYITPDDLSEMIAGIYDRMGKEIDNVRLQSIFSDKEEFTTRSQIALVLEMLIDSFDTNKEYMTKVSYSDVTSDMPEYQALVKLTAANINPGYGNNVFARSENITWFESVTLLDHTLKYLGLIQANVNMNAPAEKSDLDRLKEILAAKKAKIRSILRKK